MISAETLAQKCVHDPMLIEGAKYHAVGARVSKVTFIHLPQSLKSHIKSFETLGQVFNPNIFMLRQEASIPSLVCL
jgi:hypothetical protein